MSEQQDLAPSIPAQSRPRHKINLLTSLIILAIIYFVFEIPPLFLSLVAQNAIYWFELCQWLCVIAWLLIGVRPPFMEWVKRERASRQ